jgi:toxin ParE1/3/4
LAELRWQESAVGDLAHIRDYIALTSPRAAQSVVDRVLRAVDHLTAFPESGRTGQVRDTRELVVPGLPYVVVYRYSEDRVDIAAVFHGAPDRSD